MRVFRYSHLSTKIRAMKGKMLTKDDYEQMMNKQDVRSVAQFLKHHTYYQEALEDLNENDVHRGRFEILLYRAEISDALKIARYLTGNEKKIYRYVYRKQEIEDIKKMLRTLQVGEKLENIDRKILFISKYSKIDFNKALKAKTMSELIDSIKDTNFYPILKPLLIDDNQIDLFSAEMALGMYYYMKIYDQLKTLVTGKDRELVNIFFGSDADLRNIMWIYRCKKYYSIDKEILYRYLIPYNYKLKKSEVKQMIEARDEEEIINIVRSGYYKHIFHEKSDDWEREFKSYFLAMQLKNMRLYPFSLAPILGYIYAKEMEIHNITTIIEGVRYKVNKEDIKKQLIRAY